jgi:hypothetical protein
MNLIELNLLHILHVFAAIALVATTFYACAGAPETRKKLLLWSGIASLVVVLTGVRLWGALYNYSIKDHVFDDIVDSFHLFRDFVGWWVVVKIICWLGLSALCGTAYRRREKAGLWLKLGVVLAGTAVAMVYLKPF